MKILIKLILTVSITLVVGCNELDTSKNIKTNPSTSKNHEDSQLILEPTDNDQKANSNKKKFLERVKQLDINTYTKLVSKQIEIDSLESLIIDSNLEIENKYSTSENRILPAYESFIKATKEHSKLLKQSAILSDEYFNIISDSKILQQEN